MEAILDKIASNGPWGLVCALLVLAYWKLDRDSRDREAKLLAALMAEKDGRYADNKAGTDVLLRLQEKVTTAIQQITEIYRLLPPAPGPRGER